MMPFRDLWLRARALLFPARVERELREELDFHRDMAVRRHVQAGLTMEEARRTAQRQFGPAALAADACRDERRTALVDHLQRDVRYALRSLARSPVFTIIATLTLALGIGANSALFSIADPLLTRPLPVERPEELVLFRTLGSPLWPDTQPLVPFALHEHLTAESRTFAQAFVVLLDAGRSSRRMRVHTAPGEPPGDVTWTLWVSGSFFDTLGIRPALGRFFGGEDDHPSAAPLAVISDALWQQRYGGRPDVIGSPVVLNDASGRSVFSGGTVAATIVGVAPRGFRGVELDYAPDVWLPMVPARIAVNSGSLFARFSDGSQTAGVAFAHVMARLRPGVSLQEAQAEVDVITAREFETLTAPWAAGLVAARPRIRVEPAATGFSLARERFRDPLRILIAGVGLVLLMACANVAALLLARAVSRQKELAVRLALGSGRAALVRVLLAEGLIVAVAGGALALFVAWGAGRAAPMYLPDGFPVLAAAGVNMRLLGFTAGLALLSVLLFGLAPAVWSARRPLERLLRDSPGPASTSGSVAGLHRLVIVGQVAFAVALLAGAGLFLRTVAELRAVETGFDDGRLVQFDLELGGGVVPPELIERLAGLPGVESLTAYGGSGDGPLQGEDGETPDTIHVSPDGQSGVEAMGLGVKPRFFDTMGIPIVAGRPFRDGEWPPANGSLAVLSASLATRLFGGADAAVGQRVAGIGGDREVIGVAGDVTQHSLRDAQAWIIYVPVIPRVSVTSSIVLRTSVDPAPLAPAVRAAVREYSTQFEVRDWRTYGDIREASIVTERLLARLATVFAALAALLAAVGIYGVVAYTMAQRTPEIGLRMALGAEARDVIRLVVGRVLGLTAVGAAMGLLGAWAGTRLVAGLLFGVSPADPATLGAALLLLACVAGIASYVPARRAASRIDPAVVLRGE